LLFFGMDLQKTSFLIGQKRFLAILVDCSIPLLNSVEYKLLYRVTEIVNVFEGLWYRSPECELLYQT
jgi:hypothetical protein